ncbi:carboxypeptidase regulatory-like domain-containing protein [Cellulomonas gilvus]|uniref:Carboxypeptidase regulatory-like domain-containing protein n=1 Tax=Cellulomonas gilvus (strain ATCC 13127 / NRRL B-14078) TaxID=593907 RepID=F8A3T3_CELGA|nr:carboxypeptidase regulatory-like domain-containing protein [Cellulomonas gilvus]AEI11986.1 hypothetical protein Celgi_1467 [Cellulomonas gilvus ATCC 13127]
MSPVSASSTATAPSQPLAGALPPRRLRRLALAVVGLLVATLLPAVAPAGAAETIALSGRVTDESGVAISGLQITVYPSYRSTRTAADGTYRLTGLVPGQWQVAADDHVEDRDLWRRQYWDGTQGVESYVSFASGSAELAGVDFHLRPNAGIAGRAVDETGAPLPFVEWTAYRWDDDEQGWQGRRYGPQVTDAEGRMWSVAQPGSVWRLCFADEWYQTTSEVLDVPWTPEVRHQTGCWNAAGKPGVRLQDADDMVFTALGQRVAATVTMPTLGRSIAPAQPWISGGSDVGATLRAHAGTWAPSDVRLSYRWYTTTSTDTLLEGLGGTGPTFATTSAHRHEYVWLEVTATRPGHAPMSSRTMIPVGQPAPRVTSPLRITGTPAPGRTLVASHGTATPSTTTTTYAWFVDGIRAGSGPTFALAPEHRESVVEVRAELYEPTGGVLRDRVAVRVPGLPFTAAPSPTVAGSAVVGSTLTASVGTWAPSPTSLSYQWLRGDVAIPGATARSYRLTAVDRGAQVRVRVTASRPSYEPTSRTSSATAAVRGVLTAPTPTVSGVRRVGARLTAVTGTWRPSPVALSYQWYRNGRAITGARAATYVLKAADRGMRIEVKVTGRKEGYVTAARRSAKTVAIG